MSSIERPINKEEDDKFFADMKARIEQNPELLKQPAAPTVDEIVKELSERNLGVDVEDITQNSHLRSLQNSIACFHFA